MLPWIPMQTRAVFGPKFFCDNIYILNKGERGHAMLPSSASSREGAKERRKIS